MTKKEKENVGIKPTPLIVTHSNEIPETETSQIESYNISLSNSPIQTLLNTPEYDLLSRQPEQFAEETYRLVNFKSKSEADRQRIYPSKKEPVHGYQTRSTEFRSIVTATKDSGKFSKVSQVHAVSSVEKKSKPRQSRTNKPVTPSIQPSRTLKESSIQTQLASKPPRKSHQSGRDNRGSSGTRKPSRPKESGKRSRFLRFLVKLILLLQEEQTHPEFQADSSSISN